MGSVQLWDMKQRGMSYPHRITLVGIAGLLASVLIVSTAAAAGLQSSLLKKPDLPAGFKTSGSSLCMTGADAARLESASVRSGAQKAGLSQVCETVFKKRNDTVESHAMSFGSASGTAWGMSYVHNYVHRTFEGTWKSIAPGSIGSGARGEVRVLKAGDVVLKNTVAVYWHKGSKVGWVVGDGIGSQSPVTTKLVTALARRQAGRM